MGTGKVFFRLIQTLRKFWAERILILRICIFLIFWDPKLKFPDFQTGPGPSLGRAWAGPGRDAPELGLGWTGLGLGRAWAGLGWAWAGLGLCLFDVLNMFPPLMKKPPMFLVPWILEASFAFFCIK